MIDPISNFTHALYLILQRLPDPYLSFIGVFAVSSVAVFFIRMCRNL